MIPNPSARLPPAAPRCHLLRALLRPSPRAAAPQRGVAAGGAAGGAARRNGAALEALAAAGVADDAGENREGLTEIVVMIIFIYVCISLDILYLDMSTYIDIYMYK